jgi:DNA-binding CsgD family transcriptional regulator
VSHLAHHILSAPLNRPAGYWGLPEQYECRFRQALAALELLTVRESEVFALLGLGLANRLIAKDLGVTERTVKAHVRQIFDKLGVDGRTEAAVVSFIWRSGLTSRLPTAPVDRRSMPPGLASPPGVGAAHPSAPMEKRNLS